MIYIGGFRVSCFLLFENQVQLWGVCYSVSVCSHFVWCVHIKYFGRLLGVFFVTEPSTNCVRPIGHNCAQARLTCQFMQRGMGFHLKCSDFGFGCSAFLAKPIQFPFHLHSMFISISIPFTFIPFPFHFTSIPFHSRCYALRV